eukprot:21383-Heterococcus_DN1.PRE.1
MQRSSNACDRDTAAAQQQEESSMQASAAAVSDSSARVLIASCDDAVTSGTSGKLACRLMGEVHESPLVHTVHVVLAGSKQYCDTHGMVDTDSPYDPEDWEQPAAVLANPHMHTNWKFKQYEKGAQISWDEMRVYANCYEHTSS